MLDAIKFMFIVAILILWRFNWGCLHEEFMLGLGSELESLEIRFSHVMLPLYVLLDVYTCRIVNLCISNAFGQWVRFLGKIELLTGVKNLGFHPGIDIPLSGTLLAAKRRAIGISVVI